jgi:hypothetical protein
MRRERDNEPEFCEWPATLSSAGQPKGPTNPGRLFFGFFLLAKQKKETCRRATPGIGLGQMATVSFCEKKLDPGLRRDDRQKPVPRFKEERHSTAISKQKRPKLLTNRRVSKLKPNPTTAHTFTNPHPNRQ